MGCSVNTDSNRLCSFKKSCPPSVVRPHAAGLRVEKGAVTRLHLDQDTHGLSKVTVITLSLEQTPQAQVHRPKA